MVRRCLIIGSLFALAGCGASDAVQPAAQVGGTPSRVIVDGAHQAGNPDFFFLPPMVPDPSKDPNYEATAFNASLTPTVDICALDVGTAPSPGEATLCKSGGYTVSATLPGPTDGKYQYDWKVPTSADTYYRIAVRVGLIRLGFADVKAASSGAEIKNVNTNELVPLLDGRTLPVKFRVERYALCQVAGVGPCTSQTVNLATGGTVSLQLPGPTGLAGVIIPPQGTGNSTTVTVTGCADLHGPVTDLPTFGPCLRITANPALTSTLAIPAVVFVCSLTAAGTGLNLGQADLVTLLRYDASPDRVAALPHAAACGPSFASAGTLTNLLARLVAGDVRAAGRALVAMIAPKMLYATNRRLDVGAGGSTPEFSDFQFALPVKLEKIAGDNQSGAPGAELPVKPTVKVTDLLGMPVQGATVRFANNIAACAALGSTTVGANSGPTGEVVDGSWTLSSTPGTNTRAACGRGLAGSDFNGPRDAIDPFQPLSTAFGDLSSGPQVPVVTGSVLFTATGISLPATLVGFGEGGYRSYGPGTEPTGWPSLAPATSSMIGSQAPFTSGNAYCSVTAGPETFPLGSDATPTQINVIKSFYVPVAGTLTITVRIDNDLRMWIDGTEVTNQIPPTANYVAPWWKHENCADINPAVLTRSVAAGTTHTVALMGRDRGVFAWLDMQVILNSNSP